MSPAAAQPADPLVIGVDFGTLSGRAVVVRVADGDSGSAVSPTPGTPSSPRRCPAQAQPPAADWALQVPADYVDVLRHAVPEARRARPGSTRRRRRHRHRLHGLHRAADPRRRHPAVRAAGVAPTARTPSRSCGSTTPRSRTPTGSTRSPPSAASPGSPRYGGRISSEWEFAKALQLLEEDPEVYAAHGPLGRGGRLDRLAAVRHLRAQRLHRRLQGHPPGRRATRPGLPRRAEPGFADFVDDKLDHPIGRSAPRPAG